MTYNFTIVDCNYLTNETTTGYKYGLQQGLDAIRLFSYVIFIFVGLALFINLVLFYWHPKKERYTTILYVISDLFLTAAFALSLFIVLAPYLVQYI